MPVASADGGARQAGASFNSLFEMLDRWYTGVIYYTVEVSILYLRCRFAVCLLADITLDGLMFQFSI